MIPEIKLGISVLTNQESQEAFAAISYYLLDHFLSAGWDWLSAYEKTKARADSALAREERSRLAGRNSSSRPAPALENYAGEYTDDWYGAMTLTSENGRLVMRFGHTLSLIGDLEHWQYDTFICRWRDPELRADAYVTFNLGPDGKPEQLKMRAISSATDFSFDFQDLLFKPVVRK